MYGMERVAAAAAGAVLLVTTITIVVTHQASLASAYSDQVDGRGPHDLAQELSQIELQRKREHSWKDEAANCGRLNKEATDWIDKADKKLGRLLNKESNANWNYLTNLTNENSQKLELAMADFEDWMWPQIETAKNYLRKTDEICNSTTLRLLRMLTHFPSVPIAKDLDTRRQLTHLQNTMQEIYSTVTVTRNGKTYRLYPELTDLMATSRDYDELLWAWSAWHNTTGRKMKNLYAEYVEKANQAARDNDFRDVGIYWQVGDFDQDNVEKMMDELYEEIRPFYEQLHAYVRQKLSITYPDIDTTGSIPAHLLGNMWAQEWDGILDLLVPFPNASSKVDVTKAMEEQGYTPLRMFQLAEEFFVSIGLERMTSDFWSKSMIVRPEDNRPVECHGSAEDFFKQADFRIKMCTEVNVGDLHTVHHEMGHIEYFMLYRNQPTLFRTGANGAFHEAAGDTISLSVMTDKHLTAIGLMFAANDKRRLQEIYEQDINFLLRMALSKVAFLPFGYIVDKWRYKVFRGEVTPDEYTESWWELREYYEGIVPPVQRTSRDFDPGAKYHIPANVPYSRYFFSFIGQFQFQSSLCKLSGHRGPLYKCDIYESKVAGDRLRSVFSLGASRPWQETMKLLTGQRQFKANAILEYFQPLIDWLTTTNKNTNIGWRSIDGTKK